MAIGSLLRFSAGIANVGRPASLVTMVCVTLASTYFAALFGWAAVYALIGDRTAWLFAINSLAFYYFLPLPLVALVVLLSGRKLLWGGLVLSIALWAYLWGPLFLPRLSEPGADGPRLRVMTYNLLGFNLDSDAVVRTIRASNADVVALNELNVENAAAIVGRLSSDYPYQLLDPEFGVTGGGVISRFPLRENGHAIDDPEWVSEPQILELDVDGRSVTFVRFHCKARPSGFAARERQARKLAAFAREHDGPLVMAGDLNATSTNEAYAAIAGVLDDAWREAGWGAGNTFPGAAAVKTPGSSRPEVFGFDVPRWLVRIDYVFHSDDWQTASVRTGPFDGASDHRPVVAELALRQ
jgi:endonuclease/exonuclease/phosphatase (EEP) superfamily protein YafD